MSIEGIGSLNWCLNINSLREDVRPQAAKLFTLCAMYPDMPAGLLFDLVTEEITTREFIAQLDKYHRDQ